MKTSLVYLSLTTVCVAGYLLRLHFLQPNFSEGNHIRVVGRLSDEPKAGGRSPIKLGEFSFFSKENLHYGDKVSVQGIVQRAQSGRGWILKNPEVEKIGESESLTFSYRQRQKISDFYKKLLPSTHAGLLSGMVLGTKNSLENSFFDRLKQTGTLHVVVASGTNVSIVAGVILAILIPWVNRRLAVGITLLFIWVYVFFIGWQAPIARAGVMGSMGLLGQGLGREAGGIRALVLSGAVLLMINPLWLFDLGFELSFLATFGVIYLSPKIISFLSCVSYFKKAPSAFLGDLGTSLGAQVMVAPLLAFRLGTFSWIAPLVNALVLWTVAPIMMGGMVLAIFAFLGRIGAGFGQLLAWFLYLPLEYFVQIVRLFGNS